MTALARQVPVVFSCAGDRLIGLLHEPADPGPLGVVVVTGAPQYRIGSHRQFVLLARDLAAAGFPVLRFDYRGMGDSDGDFVGFEGVDDDIRAAVDVLFERVPGLERVVLWGLCDGASASVFFAAKDPRVAGLVLLNPWVRSEASLAQAQISRHYGRRLASRRFWIDLLSGRIAVWRAARGFVRTLAKAFTMTGEASHSGSSQGPAGVSGPLAERVSRSAVRFSGRVLLILSGDDLTAREFEQTVLGRRDVASWVGRDKVTIQRLGGANHTYSSVSLRRRVHDWTIEWLRGI